MGHPAVKQARRATYADLEAVPPNKVAELIGGTLHVMPRPAPRHARSSSALGGTLFNPFDKGDGGPGGWWILDEPELHFPDPHPEEPGDIEAVVPDIAGWRRDRMPELPETAHFELAPDWICEVISKSTEDVDRKEKMPIYAREGVAHVWLVDPLARTLEVCRLENGRWVNLGAWRDDAKVRAEPFGELELELGGLWAT
jgi:Uma2 family endonuclease